MKLFPCTFFLPNQTDKDDVALVQLKRDQTGRAFWLPSQEDSKALPSQDESRSLLFLRFIGLQTGFFSGNSELNTLWVADLYNQIRRRLGYKSKCQFINVL